MRRPLLLPLLGLVHVAVIAVLLQPGARAATPAPPAMVVTAIPAPGVIAEVARAPVMPEIPPQVAIPEFTVAADEVAVTSGPCALTANVQAALQRSADARHAVARIPRGARSVSNALLLWDGAWAAPSSVGGDATLGPIRATVEAEVRAAPAACRNETVVGPRLIVVADPAVPVVLAFGSGQWSWEKLL